MSQQRRLVRRWLAHKHHYFLRSLPHDIPQWETTQGYPDRTRSF